MNILFVSAILPYPLYSGGQIRIYNLLKRLSKKHQITLVSFIRDDKERALKKELAFCKEVIMIKRGFAWQPKYILRALFSSYPFLLSTYVHSGMHRLLAKRLATGAYDVVHLEPFYVWPSIPHTHVPVVVAEHNIEYTVYRRYVSGTKFPFLRPLLSWDVSKIFFWERHVWRNATAVTAVSPSDARVIETYLSHDIAIVPNGVDVSAFTYKRPQKTGTKRIVFVGNFRWLPNRQAAEELVTKIWPHVKKQHPDALLRIVGKHMNDDLKNAVRAAGGQAMTDVSDIRSIYHDADMLVAPHTIPGGTKYKMLEAMASGLPIVTTSEGMEGLDAHPGEHYLEAYTKGEFVSQISTLWHNYDLSVRLTQNSRKLVEEKYSWDEIARTQDSVWKDAYAKKHH